MNAAKNLTARDHCRQLMAELSDKKRIDLNNETDQADPRLKIDYLFGPARGKMFGILLCLDLKGREIILKSFSGQYNGIWQVDGWAPPLFDLNHYHQLTHETEREIKDMGRIISSATSDSAKTILKGKRKKLSQQLMREIHGIYHLTNFQGETKPLTTVFSGNGGIPSGTGDCCAPKLLNLAVSRKLIPIDMAEFYWGQNNLSQSRQHGNFYPPCHDKCQPILPFMLKGAKIQCR